MVFFLGFLALGIFALRIERLNAIGITFGLERGADVIVYFSIILLFYFYIYLIGKSKQNQEQLTKFISQFAIEKALFPMNTLNNRTIWDDFIVHIRVYNEAETLAAVIDQIIAFGFHKLILVNDGSQDDSLAIIQEKIQKYPDYQIYLVSHCINRGGGAANKTGFAFAKKYRNHFDTKWLVTFDPDGQMDIQDMNSFFKNIKENPEIWLFLGSRFIEGAEASNIPRSRKTILCISRLITRFFYSLKVSDPHNGYRVMNHDTLSKITITADGMHYANEINEQIAKKKIPFKEVPVHILYTAHSLEKGQKNSNSIKLGLQMIYQKFF